MWQLPRRECRWGKRRQRRDLGSFSMARVVIMARMQGKIRTCGYGWLMKGNICYPLLILLVSRQPLPPTHTSGMAWLMIAGRHRGHCSREVSGGSSGCRFVVCLCKKQCKLQLGDDGWQQPYGSKDVTFFCVREIWDRLLPAEAGQTVPKQAQEAHGMDTKDGMDRHKGVDHVQETTHVMPPLSSCILRLGEQFSSPASLGISESEKDWLKGW